MAELWAMEQNKLQTYLETVLNITPEQIAVAEASMQGQQLPDKNPVIVSMDGDTAILKIEGTLLKGKVPSWLAYYGIKATSYEQIIEAVETIKANASITDVRVLYDTPGGMVNGVDETYQAMLDLATSKTVTAEARGMIASGGYYIASPSSKIVSSAPNNEIGSIGVVVVYTSWKKAEERFGVKEIVIVSRNAPKKAPDPETKEGRQVIQNRVDALERIFYARISEGRGISTEDIAKKFGQGGLLVSYDPDPAKDDAVSVGMIDAVLGIGKNKKMKVKAKENSKMPTLTELMQTDPSIKAEVEARELAARNAGIQSGRDVIMGRVNKVTPFLSNSAYPPAITALAVKVLKGDSEPAALEGAVAVIDAQAEAAKAAAAAGESAAGKETPGQHDPAQPNEDGSVNNEIDMNAAVERDRKRLGLKGGN